ncbi:hypothetical protein M3697_13630 [Janibacter melonis]|uniref:hypothetical protein n=1 Tax=Janibacter TaxID=53457 RepID=UPI001785903B|nr:hypothetical protein [Janibacter melonis]MCM3556137.1 hypothetical protein [Janibacter melonis]
MTAVIASVVIGVLAAGGATYAVLGSSAPDDKTAVEQGPTAPVAPEDLLTYGD